MAVVDDVRRLMQLDFMFLGFSVLGTMGAAMGPTGQASQPARGTRVAFNSLMITRSPFLQSARTARSLGLNSAPSNPRGRRLRPSVGGIQVTIPIANVRIPAGALPPGVRGATVVTTVTLAQSLPRELS
jgi:hypothetical protein